MHGRIPFRFAWTLVLLTASASGCAGSAAPAAEMPGCAAAERFDPETASCITGQVVWTDNSPIGCRFAHRLRTWLEDDVAAASLRRNSCEPSIDTRSGGVGNALVFLRGVDIRRACAWNHPRVFVELRDLQLHVVEGARDVPVGLVRRGAAIDMMSCESRFHALRARGAAYFTLMFPDPYQPLTRVLDRAGVVELSSGAGYYWMRGYLLVADDPYCTRTGADGRFTLAQVPPGRYEIVCWLPSWREAEHDRDPETGFVTRLRFGAPAVVTRGIELGAKQEQAVRLELSNSDFQSAACASSVKIDIPREHNRAESCHGCQHP